MSVPRRHHSSFGSFDIVQLGDTFANLNVFEFQMMNQLANSQGLLAEVHKIEDVKKGEMFEKRISGCIIANLHGKPAKTGPH